MSSYGEQIAAARTAHLAASAVEALVRQQVTQAFTDWDAGHYDAQTIRHRLEAIIRQSYRASAAIAVEYASQQSGLPKWKPSGTVFTSDYLTALIKDVQRNLREFKSSPRETPDYRRHILRIQHAAGVAAQRGYTDALIESYADLEEMGYQLQKVWLANFINNTPCPTCAALHGTSVGLREEFPFALSVEAKVYLNLQGPPRHPRCQCYLCILVTDLTNVGEELDVDSPSTQPGAVSMTTDQVKSLPSKVFKALVASFRAIKNFFSKGKS